VVPTFNSTLAKPKHRIVLLPSRTLSPEEFDIAWPKMAAELARAGVVVDKGCKNINRLYFACVSPSPARWTELGGARFLTGAPIDVEAMLSAAKADRETQEARARAASKPRPVREEHRDKYIAAAIRRERGNIESASEGGRHDALLKAAWALARFGLSEAQIADELLESFVAVAGEPRRREGERAIHDAIAARGVA
jgi:hypothetical protein